jgi:hypothetical protein
MNSQSMARFSNLEIMLRALALLAAPTGNLSSQVLTPIVVTSARRTSSHLGRMCKSIRLRLVVCVE